MTLIRTVDVPQNQYIGVQLPRPAYGVRIENHGNVMVSLKDDLGKETDVCPPGFTLGWNHPEGLYSPQIGCVGYYQGFARVYLYDREIDIAQNPNTQQAGGTIPVSIASGVVTIDSGIVDLAPGTTVALAGTPTVQVGNVLQARIQAGNVSVINTNANPIPVNLAPATQQLATITNAAYFVTMDKGASEVAVFFIPGSCTVQGFLDVYYVQTFAGNQYAFYFFKRVAIGLSASNVDDTKLPLVYRRRFPAGTLLGLLFTGTAQFGVSYV